MKLYVTEHNASYCIIVFTSLLGLVFGIKTSF